MAKQDRAIRTRQTILEAAARVFEQRGYQAATITEILSAAGTTKGALYFHFPSKEDLAQGVLSYQTLLLNAPERAIKTQQLVDMVMLHGHRLQTDPMVRAGVRLSLDQLAHELDRSGSFLKWGKVLSEILEEARASGELLPHVDPVETADVIVGCFGGIQAMSQALNNYADLTSRLGIMLRHILPNVVNASVLATVDATATRGAAVSKELDIKDPE